MGQQIPDHLQPGGPAQATSRWVAVENIANFEKQMKSETDTCRRKLLEGLLVLEREKLKTISPTDR